MIHKAYPHLKELQDFINKNCDFFKSLKLADSKRFIFSSIIYTSRTPKGHPFENDEIIGMWYFDKNTKIFKQDFIVDKDSGHSHFISYTAKQTVKKIQSQYVKKIDEFFSIYGNNGVYYHNDKKWQHHYKSISDLPNESSLRTWAQQIKSRIRH